MSQMQAADAARILDRNIGAIGWRAWAGWATLAVGLAFVALACAYRLLAFRVAIFDGDEYAFALVARDVVHGIAPDAGVFDNKPVGLTYLFALAEALGGQTVIAIRSLGFMASAACGALLFAASRRLDLSRGLALQVAAAFMLGTLFLGGFGSMSELLAAPLLAAANLLLARGGRRPAALAGAGLAFGLAFQVTYLAGPCAALTTFGVLLADPGRPFGARLRDFVLIGLAGAAAVCAVWLPQIAAGEWGRYMAEQIRYHEGYRAPEVDWSYFSLGFAVPLAAMGLPILAAVWLRTSRSVGRAEPLPPMTWILGLQLLGAVPAASASNRFYPHYLILALPAAAGLMAVLLAGTAEPARRIGAAVLTAMLALTAVSPAGFLRTRIETRSLEERAAAVVDRLTRPDQSLFVYDEAQAVYYLARRPAASRYVFPTHYLSSCDHAPTIVAPETVLAQALARRPALVLIGRLCSSEIDAAAQVRGAGYRKVDQIDAGGRRIAVYAPAGRGS